MRKINSIRIRKKPYKISKNGKNGLKVNLCLETDFKVGDEVFQEKTSDGVVLLVPKGKYE